MEDIKILWWNNNIFVKSGNSGIYTASRRQPTRNYTHPDPDQKEPPTPKFGYVAEVLKWQWASRMEEKMIKK